MDSINGSSFACSEAWRPALLIHLLRFEGLLYLLHTFIGPGLIVTDKTDERGHRENLPVSGGIDLCPAASVVPMGSQFFLEQLFSDPAPLTSQS